MGEGIVGGRVHGSRVKTRNLIAIQIACDVAQGGKNIGDTAHAFQRDALFFKKTAVAVKIAARRRYQHGLFPQQGQAVGDVSRATAAPLVHTVHHEADADHAQLVRKNVIVQVAFEGHDAVKGQRAGNVYRHGILSLEIVAA